VPDIPDHPSTALKITAFILQMIGIGCTAVAYAKTYREHGESRAIRNAIQAWGARMRQRATRLFHRRRHDQRIPGVSAAATATAFGDSAIAIDDIEVSKFNDELSLLRVRIEELFARNRQLAQEITDVHRELSRVEGVSKQEDEVLHARVKSVAVGTIRLQMIGIGFLAAGTIVGLGI
jgi:transposase